MTYVSDASRRGAAVLMLVTCMLNGCDGNGGNGGDATEPTATLTSPGDTVSGTVTLEATASDDVGVTEARFLVDGDLIGSDSSAPYSIDWDTSTIADGAHTLRVDAVDTDGNVGQSQGVTVTVDNAIDFAVTLSSAFEVPAHETAASGTAEIAVNRATRAVSGSLTVSDMTASAAHIHDAHAGANGPILIGLEQSATDPNVFDVPANTVLTEEQFADLQDAGFYLNAHSEQFPGGEVRGQLVPPGWTVIAVSLTGREEVPRNDDPATGSAALTVETATRRVFAHLTLAGLDDATAAHVHRALAGTNGDVVVPLEQDGSAPEHWFADDVVLAQGDFDAAMAGELYFNAHDGAHPAGVIRGQIVPEGIEVLFTDMTGNQVVPAVDTTATGLAATTTNLTTRGFVAHVNTSGLADPTTGSVNLAIVGTNGDVLADLAQDDSDPAHWFSAPITLDQQQFEAYQAGGTYVIIGSVEHGNGEIRGQITPPSAPPADTTDPTVTITAPVASATVSGTVNVTADASDDVGVTVVRFFVGGTAIGNDTTAPYSVSWDTTTAANGAVVLTAEAEDAAGNVGTSDEVSVNVSNGSGVTLAQIQQSVLTPICAGCHTGPTSGTLPGGMDLTSTQASFNALVGVASIEVPSLQRVNPGDPDASYLIDKLEGTQTVGERMPLGGQPLPQATIDQIRAWIADGAPGP
jgi:hypothetical protein